MRTSDAVMLSRREGALAQYQSPACGWSPSHSRSTASVPRIAVSRSDRSSGFQLLSFGPKNAR